MHGNAHTLSRRHLAHSVAGLTSELVSSMYVSLRMWINHASMGDYMRSRPGGINDTDVWGSAIVQGGSPSNINTRAVLLVEMASTASDSLIGLTGNGVPNLNSPSLQSPILSSFCFVFVCE